MTIVALSFFIVICIFMAIVTYVAKHKPHTKSDDTPAPQSNHISSSAAPTSHRSGPVNRPYSFDKNIPGLTLAYEYHDVDVAMFEKSSIEKLFAGEMVFFRQEPENSHDPRAIKIVSAGKKIGYLYKGRLQDMANDWIDKEREYSVFISQIDMVNESIKIAIGFYKNKEYVIEEDEKESDPTIKKFKLTGNKNKEMQDALVSASPGESVDVTYDYDKEKYLVSTYCDLGYMPTSAEKYLEENPECYIDEIDINENGKYEIVIAIKIDD